MIAYLTSHVGGSYKKNGTRIPTQLSADNGLLDSLQKHWKDNSKIKQICEKDKSICVM